jgi:hypothetical protein
MKNNEKFIWIKKIIETCTNDFHFMAVDKLIELFYELDKDDSLKEELIATRNKKWNKIHFILT